MDFGGSARNPVPVQYWLEPVVLAFFRTDGSYLGRVQFDTPRVTWNGGITASGAWSIETDSIGRQVLTRWSFDTTAALRLP